MGRIIKFLFVLIIFIHSYSYSFKIISENLEYSFYKNGKLLWCFKTKKFVQKNANIFKGEKVCVINKIKKFKIWAEEGFYNKREDKFLFKKNVHLLTSEYGEVYTQKLLFFPKKDLILTDVEVIVKKEGLIIRGKGLIYDIKTGDFKIKEKTKVKMKL